MCGGQQQGARKTNRANLNCAPCSVDTRLGRPAYHGRLSPAMREKTDRAPLPSRLIPTASSTPAWAWAWGALAPGRLVPAPRSSGPSHTVRGGRPVQTEQNRTNVVPTPSHHPRPITQPSGGALANDESDAAPNRGTSESDRARYPGPAAATCLTPARRQAGLPARLSLSHPAQGRPQTPQSRSQLGARGTRTAAPPEVARPVHGPCGCCQIPPALLFLPCHGPWHPHPIPNPIPAQASPAPVLVCLSLSRSLALFRQVLSMDGLDGLMRDFFSLVLRPLPT